MKGPGRPEEMEPRAPQPEPLHTVVALHDEVLLHQPSTEPAPAIGLPSVPVSELFRQVFAGLPPVLPQGAEHAHRFS